MATFPTAPNVSMWEMMFAHLKVLGMYLINIAIRRLYMYRSAQHVMHQLYCFCNPILK